MFRRRKKQQPLIAHPAAGANEPSAFDGLPFIDNEALDDFLADPQSVGMLPVDPSGYRREIQRMIVSAFLRDASEQAKSVEARA